MPTAHIRSYIIPSGRSMSTLLFFHRFNAYGIHDMIGYSHGELVEIGVED